MRQVSVGKLGPDNTVASVPVSDEVQAVIERWGEEHGEELQRRLEPFGLGNYDIVQPRYRRVVREDEEHA